MDKKKQEEYHFVKEHIKKIPVDRKKLRTRLIGTILLAVLFGVVAAFVFAALRPVFDNLLHQKDNTVVISGQDETSDEVPEESDPVYITEAQPMEPEDYQVLQNKLYAIGREANKSVVAVRGIGETTDWFENAYQTESQGTGIIVADTGDDYLVVTEKKVISDTNQVDVTFYDDSTASAVMQAYDENTGIAMLRVEKRQLSADTTNRVEAATLSNSSALSQGTIVIAIGSPLGEPFSILTGNVTSSSHEVSTVDANYKVISTDINASDAGSGALINLKGEVVGLMLQSYSTREAQSTVTAIGISQISKLLEKMSNGESPAYLGLEISTVTSEIASANQLPKGVYIKQVSTDSPAMQAGIQVGDVLTKIGGKEILTAEQYEDYVLNAKDGQQSTVTVKRMGADGKYQDLSFKVVFGTLQEN
ncbi:S1C family serine protease [uncultured Eubacterium sp.]|uniref:S1C family serine protease n=1 Tax=uncultured Eubacterium sp. TaxID=165185 RepID=UPI0025D19D04|nr:S1C family serine protease [uncultured Eubacterium sp.]MCI6536919.1 S1C family serine protease [Lachnospiraceae bacterium]